ncbi:unnamed protein product [Prorocentrum cordatum]|uniref:PCI domain-containing protein n=1 Tax=Prorocentrum cordatum TaxID=2364126 RepID=A0ABN9TWT6_9DINO|nr:unnamed protein product [Polarella glacialis]
MANFMKPESALLKAEAFIDVQKKHDALEVLHQAIQHRKLKSQWTPTSELIMVKHLELCVELQKMRIAREGLYQYRTMCQAANISSLENVVKKFRMAAEEKVNEAKRQKDIKMAELGDFDEMESPQTILLRSIQQGDTRQQSQDRDVHVHFRFLWDTYKLILDVLKSGNRLEDVYHETSQHAMEFCRANERPQEFKRLCETLRKNFADLHKHGVSGKAAQTQVNPSNPDTVLRTLDTRTKQLQIATELDLWRESYNIANEMFELMAKVPRVKPRLRSQYYDFLGQIFWKADNHLFHAFACLKNLNITKAGKQDLSKEELSLLASKAVLSTLCVPFQKGGEMQMQSLELTTEGASSPHEKAKKHAVLFHSQTVPTRESISSQLVEKGLLSLALQPCRDLFDLIESDFTPLSLCQDAKPLLDQVSELLDGKLEQYIVPLKQIIFFRLMKQLSDVYASMTIENFEKAASIVSFSIAEKWMANASRQHGINIQINYSDKAIVFGSPRKADMKSMRQPLIEVGYKLQQAMVRVAPEEQHKKEKLEKQQLEKTIVRRIEEETKLIRQRKEEIERRKEDSEKRKQEQLRKDMEKQREQEEREAALERARLQQEREQREREREQQKKRDAEREKNKEMLEEMKKQAEQNNTNLKINVSGGGSKKITEVHAEDLEKISVADIERAREAQVLRERQEKIRQRKLESKRVDHLARALREQELPYLDDWAYDVEEQDRAFLEVAEERCAEQQRKKHAEDLKEKALMMVFEKAKEAWAAELLEAREEEYFEKVKERERRLEQKVVDLKIANAKKRFQEYEKEMEEERARKKREQEEEERKEEERKAKIRREREAQERLEREEEERREREEQEEEARKQKEEDRKRREEERKAQAEAADRALEKRLAREREIEERQAKGGEREPDRRPAARREEEGDGWRRGGDRDRGDREEPKGGAWRSGTAGDRDGWRKRGEDRTTAPATATAAAAATTTRGPGAGARRPAPRTRAGPRWPGRPRAGGATACRRRSSASGTASGSPTVAPPRARRTTGTLGDAGATASAIRRGGRSRARRRATRAAAGGATARSRGARSPGPRGPLPGGAARMPRKRRRGPPPLARTGRRSQRRRLRAASRRPRRRRRRPQSRQGRRRTTTVSPWSPRARRRSPPPRRATPASGARRRPGRGSPSEAPRLPPEEDSGEILAVQLSCADRFPRAHCGAHFVARPRGAREGAGVTQHNICTLAL